MQLHHIVVATDESEPGRSAVRAGLDLATRSSARLTIMRVIPPAGPDGGGEALVRLQQWVDPDLTAEPAPVVELGIAFGVPAIEICRFAEQRQADLLILGKKHRSAVARLLIGDTADAVIRRSRVPCLFMEQGSHPVSRLLVALDGTERGMAVFTGARAFADAVGAGIGVVTVENVDAVLSEVPGEPLPLTRSSRLWRELEPATARASSARGPIEPPVAIRRGHVVAEVMSELAESGADVLAFGCHRGGPAGILDVGGTARHLAHTAPVSVFTIPL